MTQLDQVLYTAKAHIERLNVLPRHSERDETMFNTRLKWISRGLRSAAPYLLVELLLPGGTLIALLLWLSQYRASATLGAQSKR